MDSLPVQASRAPATVVAKSYRPIRSSNLRTALKIDDLINPSPVATHNGRRCGKAKERKPPTHKVEVANVLRQRLNLPLVPLGASAEPTTRKPTAPEPPTPAEAPVPLNPLIQWDEVPFRPPIPQRLAHDIRFVIQYQEYAEKSRPSSFPSVALTMPRPMYENQDKPGSVALRNARATLGTGSEFVAFMERNFRQMCATVSDRMIIRKAMALGDVPRLGRPHAENKNIHWRRKYQERRLRAALGLAVARPARTIRPEKTMITPETPYSKTLSRKMKAKLADLKVNRARLESRRDAWAFNPLMTGKSEERKPEVESRAVLQTSRVQNQAKQ